jgi:endonuclease/exonuclease/phosphatase family metal-dependent hydrolase
MVLYSRTVTNAVGVDPQRRKSEANQVARALLWAIALAAVAALSVTGVVTIDRALGVTVLEPEQPRQLRVLTWNIGKVYLQRESRASDADLRRVAETILELNPHLVALQELRDRSQLGRLVAALGPGWRGMLSEDVYDRRAALVVRLPSQFIPLPTSTGRVAQGALVRLPSGLSFAVASVHLDAFDPGRRLVQAEEILAGVQRQETDHQLLAGDFNFDTAVAARGSVDHEVYRFLTRDLVDAGKDAGPTTIISRRLDYVFFHSRAVTGVRSRVLQDRRINIMDHDPLLVELTLAAAPRR